MVLRAARDQWFIAEHAAVHPCIAHRDLATFSPLRVGSGVGFLGSARGSHERTLMAVRWVGVITLCLVCLQCGAQTPVGPTSIDPTSLAPVATTPQPDELEAPPVTVPLGGGSGDVLVGAGDIAACDVNSEATARLLDSIGGTVFTLGDHAYPRGAEAEYRACYEPTWGRHRGRTRPTPGNHDYEIPGAATYFNYFGANAGPAGRGYYSYDIGTWHIVSLDSNANIETQVTWLQNDLEASRKRCTLAYWHHSLYTSGPHGETLAVRDLWRVLYRSEADVVLGSHDHMYERFAPQDHRGQTDPIRGLRQFVVGTGGAALHASRQTMPNSEVRISAFGVLKLTLGADGYEWEFISVSGPRDSGSERCH